MKAKKGPIHNYLKRVHCKLNLYGVRKSEGGVRKASYKNCFTDNSSKPSKEYDDFRPIFWIKNLDKAIYNEHYHICNSRCYTEYGLSRTGCPGCPFGGNQAFELNVMRIHEPNKWKAALRIFGKSYLYTARYERFCKKMKQKEENVDGQMNMYDFLKM